MSRFTYVAAVVSIVITMILAIGQVPASQALDSSVLSTAPVGLKPLASTIERLRGPEMAMMIGKAVSIEGFYYNGSIPMIIDDINRVKVNLVLPSGSYVPVTGDIPVSLKTGDRISVSGTLIRPSTSAPVHLRREPSALRVDNASQQFRMIRPDSSMLQQPSSLAMSAGSRVVNRPPVRPVELGVKYAVLIAGGANYASNHFRYWNDLRTMYGILLANGYSPANISVIYASGAAFDSSMPVNFSATQANISTVFNKLAPVVGPKDNVYVMLNDHGSKGSLTLWYESMPASAFAAEVNKVSAARQITIQMEQCYSGGFISFLTAPNRIVMSACGPDEPSWANATLQFNEFTFWYFAALTGSRPDGSGSVNADANGDGHVTVLEAYNFARMNDTRPETPFYEDNGLQPCHSGPMPAGGEGVFGNTIYF